MIIKTIIASRGPERLNNLLKVTQLQSGRAKAGLGLPGSEDCAHISCAFCLGHSHSFGSLIETTLHVVQVGELM